MARIRCNERRGFLPVTQIDAQGLAFYVYKGSEDYVLDEDFCTCKSFIKNLAKGKRNGCKHICSNKRIVKVVEISREEAYDIITSVLIYGQSSYLRLLEKERTNKSLRDPISSGSESGKEEEEEENNKTKADVAERLSMSSLRSSNPNNRHSYQQEGGYEEGDN